MNESQEHQNASQFPKHYYARHMQPGICGYGTEKVLVDTDAVKLMLGNDAVGKPVYVLHQTVDLAKIKEKADGYIIDSFYNELDGWAWFKILIITDEAHAAIAKDWAVSNAYVPTQWGVGGTKNNVPYDREIMNGQFTHLAIVPDPRYEDACIMTPDQFRAYQDSKKQQLEELRNSNSQPPGGKTMFKLFKNKREEVQTIDADTQIELENGKSVTLQEMINAVKKNDDNDAEMMNGDSMVECDGEKMPLKELVNRYNNAMKKNSEADEKKNADDAAAAKKKADEDEASEKKNAEEKEAKEKANAEDEEKKNANFLELQNAHLKGAPTSTVIIETGIDKLARGKANYGSPAK